MAICASREKLLQEATNICHGTLYSVAKNHQKHARITNHSNKNIQTLNSCFNFSKLKMGLVESSQVPTEIDTA